MILLRGHVGESSDQRSRLSLRRFDKPGDAEVNDFHCSLFVHHDVAWFDVAVNDAALVGVVEGAARLGGVDELQGNGNRLALGDDLLEVYALDQLHGNVGGAGFRAHIVNGYDIGVLKAAGGLRFTIKALEQVLVALACCGDGLERNEPIDDGVTGPIDETHGAVAQLIDNFVFAELLQGAPSPRRPCGDRLGSGRIILADRCTNFISSWKWMLHTALS